MEAGLSDHPGEPFAYSARGPSRPRLARCLVGRGNLQLNPCPANGPQVQGGKLEGDQNMRDICSLKIDRSENHVKNR